MEENILKSARSSRARLWKGCPVWETCWVCLVLNVLLRKCCKLTVCKAKLFLLNMLHGEPLLFSCYDFSKSSWFFFAKCQQSQSCSLQVSCKYMSYEACWDLWEHSSVWIWGLHNPVVPPEILSKYSHALEMCMNTAMPPKYVCTQTYTWGVTQPHDVYENNPVTRMCVI